MEELVAGRTRSAFFGPTLAPAETREGAPLAREWSSYNETVTAERPCGRCGSEKPVHLGYSPTKGIRFAGFQVAGWANEDICVCPTCGCAEHMGSQGRAEALRQGSWELTGKMAVGYIDVRTGRVHKRPLA
jgi:hypothetical protein